MRHVRLDEYDYSLERNSRGAIDVIRIFVDANNAVEIADIATELNQCDNRIYVEGNFLLKERAEVVNQVFTIFVSELRRPNGK